MSGKTQLIIIPVLSLFYLNILSYICIILTIRKKSILTLKSMLLHKSVFLKGKKHGFRKVQTLYLNFSFRHKNFLNRSRTKKLSKKLQRAESHIPRMDTQGDSYTTGRQRDGFIHEIWASL